jgi:hypothetical protein
MIFRYLRLARKAAPARRHANRSSMETLINTGGLIWNSGTQEKPPGIADFIGSTRSFFPSS